MSQKTSISLERERDEEYGRFEQQVAESVSSLKDPLFATDADADLLWLDYLAFMPMGRVQHYNCRCCLDFIKKYGGLVMFAIDGCQETTNPGLGLFPEILRSELHGIRSVIEAHSNNREVAGRENGNANGLSFGNNSAVTVRTIVSGVQSEYVIDRWD